MKNFILPGVAAATMMLAGVAQAQNMIDTRDFSMDDGGSVSFANVTVEADGYLVIHETDDSGAPVTPGSIAHIPVSAGENLAVTVPAALTTGKTYNVMLHSETNGNDTYDFAEGMTDVDTPVMMDGKPVMENFTVTE